MRGTLTFLISMTIWCLLVILAAGYMEGWSMPDNPGLELTAEMGWGDNDLGIEPGPIDRALLAKAKSHLKQAEIAQEIYAIDNNCYASDLEEMREADPGLPEGLSVTSSSCTGFTIESPAHDSLETICVLSKEWGKSEYHAIPTA